MSTAITDAEKLALITAVAHAPFTIEALQGKQTKGTAKLALYIPNDLGHEWLRTIYAIRAEAKAAVPS
jgi:hypothetical protein